MTDEITLPESLAGLEHMTLQDLKEKKPTELLEFAGPHLLHIVVLGRAHDWLGEEIGWIAVIDRLGASNTTAFSSEKDIFVDSKRTQSTNPVV